MLMVEPVAAVRFPAGNFSSTTSRRLYRSGSFSISGNKFQRSQNASFARKNGFRIRASAEESGLAPIFQQNVRPSSWYHPLEDIPEAKLIEGGEVRLTPAETSRTIIEVKGKATLMFSGFLDDEVEENIFWPDLAYMTDEHGNIYFQVKNDEDILKALTAEDNFVQVIIGLDTTELLNEMELSGPSDIDFGFDGLDDEEGDEDYEDGDTEDDDDENSWVSVLDNGDDQDDSDESLGDWANLETMENSHPLYFARKLAEVVSDDPLGSMDQPPVGLAIQGLLRPVDAEEHSIFQKHKSDQKPGTLDMNQIGTQDNKAGNVTSLKQSSHDEELETDERPVNGTTFYKLEMAKIKLISAHGHQTDVEVEDLKKAQPDAIAHSAAKIISRLKDGGERITQAFKSLCWRSKGIRVEEATITGVDTHGFDLRVCSATQLQTLRYTFGTRASSEYSAEKQLHDLLFPRSHQNPQKRREAHQTEL